MPEVYQPCLLFVDDDISLFPAVRDIFSPAFQVLTSNSAQSAMEELEAHPEISVILADVCMPGLSGIDLVRLVKAKYGAAKTIVLITGYSSISDACEAMRLGATDYLVKPVGIDTFRQLLKRLCPEENTETKRVPQKLFCGMIAQSACMRAMIDDLKIFADSEANVLIEGETGTGKELVARAIHECSPRKKERMEAINCAALTDTLLESELFGHEKGAFTGASSRKPGRFELADRGTLFLDEIGEMSPVMQAKMLRVLQEGEFQRVGGTKTIRVDVRVVSASNKSLQTLVVGKKFRDDLLYRLNALKLDLPPLREREGDLRLLAEHRLQELAAQYQCKQPELSEDLLERLYEHEWRGNVREFFNVMERAFIVSKSTGRIEAAHFPFLKTTAKEGTVIVVKGMEKVEREHIRYVLSQNQTNKSRAAQQLGISRDTLYRKIKKYKL